MKYIFLMLIIFSSMKLYAEDKIYRNDDTLVFNAEFTENNIDSVIESYQKQSFKNIILTSPGGDFDAGIKLGMFVNKHNIYVYVSKYCASACAMPFMMASKKDMNKNASIMLHNVSIEFAEDGDNQITVQDAIDAAKEATTRTGIMMAIFSTAGIPSDVLLKVAKSYDDDAVELHRSDLVAYGVIQ